MESQSFTWVFSNPPCCNTMVVRYSSFLPVFLSGPSAWNNVRDLPYSTAVIFLQNAPEDVCCEPQDMAEGCVEGAKPNTVLELCRIRETRFVMTLLPTQSNLYEWTNSQTIPKLFWRGLISSPHLISWKWRKGIQKILQPSKSETIRCREQYIPTLFTFQSSSSWRHLQPGTMDWIHFWRALCSTNVVPV